MSSRIGARCSGDRDLAIRESLLLAFMRLDPRPVWPRDVEASDVRGKGCDVLSCLRARRI